MNLLFVCKHNRFRSKVAEAIFNHYNKNKKIETRGAGSQLDKLRHYSSQNVLNIMEERGMPIKDSKAYPVTEGLMDWADKIIIVADNVSPEKFPAEKTEVWKISDCSQEDFGAIKRRINRIELRVKKFIKKLKLKDK